MSKIGDQPYHTRRSSMLSTFHPTRQRVEELHNLKTCLASSSRTAQTISSGLRSIIELYELVEELLRLPSNQLSLHPTRRKFLEEQLDQSLKLLDLISGVEDNIFAMSEYVQDLQSSIQRKGNPITDSRNKMKKAIKDCLDSIKQMSTKHLTCSAANTDGDHVLAEALIEARESSILLTHGF